MWGSFVDAKVLQTVARNFRTVGDLEHAGQLILSEGPQLRDSAGEKGSNEYHPELIGKATIDLDALKRCRHLLRFPEDSVRYLNESEVFVNKRAGIQKKLSICEPPHVVVSVSRNFAVYMETFLAVPARQIGIASPSGNRGLLKAMALYLNSDFVAYHQFLKSPQAGIERFVNTLTALRDLPVPFDDAASLERWETLYSRIAADSETGDLDQSSIDELNELTFDTIKLSWRARAAVADLVRVRLGLIEGKIDQSAVRTPSKNELESYARTLGDDLNEFISQSSSSRHRVDLLIGADSGLVAVELIHGVEAQSAGNVWTASEPEAHQLVAIRERLIERSAQWLYFNRNLRVYEGSRTYILKPLQRFHWTRTQAIQDAAEIIADCLEPEPGVPARTLH
jgi:hypothetical protein